MVPNRYTTLHKCQFKLKLETRLRRNNVEKRRSPRLENSTLLKSEVRVVSWLIQISIHKICYFKNPGPTAHRPPEGGMKVNLWNTASHYDVRIPSLTLSAQSKMKQACSLHSHYSRASVRQHSFGLALLAASFCIGGDAIFNTPHSKRASLNVQLTISLHGLVCHVHPYRSTDGCFSNTESQSCSPGCVHCMPKQHYTGIKP